eukprot:2931834-Rhodomonas_salina.2
MVRHAPAIPDHWQLVQGCNHFFINLPWATGASWEGIGQPEGRGRAELEGVEEWVGRGGGWPMTREAKTAPAGVDLFGRACSLALCEEPEADGQEASNKRVGAGLESSAEGERYGQTRERAGSREEVAGRTGGRRGQAMRLVQLVILSPFTHQKSGGATGGRRTFSQCARHFQSTSSGCEYPASQRMELEAVKMESRSCGQAWR